MSALSRFWFPLLVLSAGDALLSGGWLLLRPEDLFAWLQVPTSMDVILWRLLGLLNLGHGACLILAAYWPEIWAGLTLAPLVGRLLQIGVWLWVLHSEQAAASGIALGWLIAHDALWLPLWLGFLIAFTHQRAPLARRG
jgi:hypothetical protein